MYALITVSILSFLIGVAFTTMYWRRKNWQIQRLLNVFTKKYFEEQWLATGRNHRFRQNGVEYFVAEFAKPLPGPGWVVADEKVTIQIPMVLEREPVHNEFFRLRFRRNSDPKPPDHKDIGSYFYAESSGYSQAR